MAKEHYEDFICDIFTNLTVEDQYKAWEFVDSIDFLEYVEPGEEIAIDWLDYRVTKGLKAKGIEVPDNCIFDIISEYEAAEFLNRKYGFEIIETEFTNNCCEREYTYSVKRKKEN